MSLTIYGIIFSGPLMHTDTPSGTVLILEMTITSVFCRLKLANHLLTQMLNLLRSSFKTLSKYLNVPNVLACLASTGKLFQSLSVEGKNELLY